MWLYFRFSSERAKLNCVTHSVKFEYWYLKKLSMIRNKVVWDKHCNSNRLTVRNIFLFCYSRFRLMCIFKWKETHFAYWMFYNFLFGIGVTPLLTVNVTWINRRIPRFKNRSGIPLSAKWLVMYMWYTYFISIDLIYLNLLKLLNKSHLTYLLFNVELISVLLKLNFTDWFLSKFRIDNCIWILFVTFKDCQNFSVCIKDFYLNLLKVFNATTAVWSILTVDYPYDPPRQQKCQNKDKVSGIIIWYSHY